MSAPPSPLRPRLEAELVAHLCAQYPDADSERVAVAAAELMEVAAKLGAAMRVDRRAGEIASLRAELAERARRGSYPKRRWAKLRALQAAHASDPAARCPRPAQP